MTSNLGSHYLLEGIDSNGIITQNAKEQVNELLKQSFRPEFLNRLDEIVFYKPLMKDEITKILDLIIDKLAERLKEKELKLELTDRAKSFIIENGYDPVYGARPLKRYVQHNVETMVAKTIIAGDIEPDDTLLIDSDSETLFIQIKK